MPFSAPTVTLLSAAGQTVAEIMRTQREQGQSQTTGYQNLGTLRDVTGQLATAIYNVSSNTIFIQPL